MPAAPALRARGIVLTPQQESPDLLAELATNAGIHVHEINLADNTALLAVFSEAEQRAASFLDNRMLTAGTVKQTVSLQAVVDCTDQIAPRCPLRFIFHTGHVGSTLVSRLLESMDGVSALREPFVLRKLAEAHDKVDLPDSYISRETLSGLFERFLRLWGRGHAGTGTVVVKTQSNSGRVAPLLLALRPQTRAIYMNVRAEVYIATILANPFSAVDIRRLAPERMRRLQAYGMLLPAPLHQMSQGELAAMSWLAETWSQQKAVAAAPGRMLAMDFEDLLADWRAGMERILRHFLLPRDPQTLANMLANPAMTHYSKSPEHEYTQEMREKILAETRTRHGEEIRKGLEWLERAPPPNA